MAAWPATLPTFEIGMQDNRQASFIRTPVETGPAKSRARYSAVTRQLSGTMLFTAAQRATFETFYGTTISLGADEFDFTDPADGTTQSVRFVDPPSFSHLVGGGSGSALQRVTITLEVLP